MLGMMPASDSLVALTITMKRIVVLLLGGMNASLRVLPADCAYWSMGDRRDRQQAEKKIAGTQDWISVALDGEVARMG
ncbi:hypothetical protein [Pseudomonas sp. BN414]|uniref:hypothetical protein n=1 Tax=Pseudomonas sp. BN414 TaxID=2567888 RepID=UPI002454F7B0|nr:hypothetical protein [Pseudomonas sp. BN414]